MPKAAISKLGCALLGLLHQNPASGYDLRKIFSATALGTYSDSPGAIYPALQRLQQQGLICGIVKAGSGMRRRRVFHLTAPGTAQLRKWIARPVLRADVIRGLDEVMLRFAFSEPIAGPSVSVQILKSLRDELTAYIPELHLQLSAGRAIMPTSGRLALENGIQGYKCLLQWTRRALATYERQKVKSGKSRK